jgi:gluconate 2-dehydrogenase subunit 3-like protein
MSSYKEADPTLRPIDKETSEPLPATKQPGYYPGFSTLSQSPFWDEATRKIVTDRVQQPPQRRFFTADEWKFWEAVFDHLIPQTDRTPDRRIPLIPPLDARLHANHTAGYRYESMPHDREVYKLGIEAINAEAQARFGGDFLFLGNWQQEKVLQSLHDGHPQAAPEIWKRMSVHRFWRMIIGDATEAYYGHPWGWDEVGFGGPAYPRAYTRLERGEPEPWEVPERRYEWLPPAASISGELESLHDLHTEADQLAHLSPPRKL